MNKNQLPGEQKPLTAQAVEARYNPENLPQEYVGNPFVESLPGIISHEEVVKSLRVRPLFDESERSFSNESRFHCIARLFWHFFQPMEQHIRIWDYLSICIRQGYIRRNPLDISSAKRHILIYKIFLKNNLLLHKYMI